MTKLRIVGCGDYPEWCSWTQCNYKAHYKREIEVGERRQCGDGDRPQSDASTTQEMWWPLEAEKCKEWILSQSLQRHGT